MNDSEQEQIKLTTQTDQYSVAPDSSVEIPVVLTNLGGTPDQVRIHIEGIPLVWVSTEQPVLLLEPGEERQIILTIKPPAPPNAHAGRFSLWLRAVSTLNPSRSGQALVTLTVAGYEVKGRVGVLLDGVQYPVVPGEQLAIPVVLINQGLGADTFGLAVEELPQAWVSIPTPGLRLEAGEVKEAILVVQPPRRPDTRVGRRPFRILVTSQSAPEQSASIDCILTVAAFFQFTSTLEAAQADQNQPARVLIQNLSNVPASFQATWNSLEDALIFEPPGPQQISIPSGATDKLEFSAKPARRVWVGGEKNFDYTVTVKTSGQQSQTLKGAWGAKGLLPVWAVAAGGGVLLLLCLCLLGALLFPRALQDQPSTETPSLTSTATVLLPTATQSQLDQKPLLVGRNWFLVAYNDTRSVPGVQEAFTLFNPDGSLIGYTGCKDLTAAYQTTFNQISISNLNLGSGTCPEPALQQQEDAMVAILRSARSYFVADTALQVAGDAGFLNFSLTPVNRPEEVSPPQAVIQAATQSQVGQVVVFDGSASTGQVPLVSWRWDFGDGSIASGVVVQHVYRNPGTFTVGLTVSDQGGQTASTTQQIHILAAPPTSTAPPTLAPTLPPPTIPPPTTTAPPPTVAPPPVLPTATPEPPPAPPTATPEPVSEPPQANASGPSQGFIGEPVVFDASSSQPGSSPIVSYNWTFGNGTVSPVSADPSISTIYDRAGDFEVTVFVTDANGLSSYATTRTNIDARLDTAVWTLASTNGQPLLPGTAITLQFLQGRLTGFASCNTYDGRYTATDNGDGTYSVLIEGISTSRLACPQDIMAQEANYLAALQQATSAVVQENMFTLNSPAGALVFYLVQAR